MTYLIDKIDSVDMKQQRDLKLQAATREKLRKFDSLRGEFKKQKKQPGVTAAMSYRNFDTFYLMCAVELKVERCRTVSFGT